MLFINYAGRVSLPTQNFLMKIKGLLLFLFSSLLIVSCIKGPKGDTGDPGTNGSNGSTGSQGATGSPGQPGSQGPQGPQGNPGTANVIYSSWILVDSSKWVIDDSTTSTVNYTDVHTHQTKVSQDTTIDFHTDVPMPRLTSGIIDSGAVFYFFKDSAGTYAGKVYPWGPSNNTWVGTSNHPNSTSTGHYGTSFYISADYAITPSKMTLYTTWQGYGYYWDPGYFNYGEYYIPYKELYPKTKFYVRYVIIPGGISGGRLNTQGIDFKDYEMVKKYFKIPD